eukprot:3905168-Rhodomonas_salina.2
MGASDASQTRCPSLPTKSEPQGRISTLRERVHRSCRTRRNFVQLRRISAPFWPTSNSVMLVGDDHGGPRRKTENAVGTLQFEHPGSLNREQLGVTIFKSEMKH